MVSTTDVGDAEERLRKAILARDAKSLGELLSPGLVFTDHKGCRLDKTETLMSYASGDLVIRTVAFEDIETRLIAGCAVVTVTASIGGASGGTEFAKRRSYTRVWEQVGGRMQLAVAHCSTVT
jgi:hypothetical protein